MCSLSQVLCRNDGGVDDGSVDDGSVDDGGVDISVDDEGIVDNVESEIVLTVQMLSKFCRYSYPNAMVWSEGSAARKGLACHRSHSLLENACIIFIWLLHIFTHFSPCVQCVFHIVARIFTAQMHFCLKDAKAQILFFLPLQFALHITRMKIFLIFSLLFTIYCSFPS